MANISGPTHIFLDVAFGCELALYGNKSKCYMSMYTSLTVSILIPLYLIHLNAGKQLHKARKMCWGVQADI